MRNPASKGCLLAAWLVACGGSVPVDPQPAPAVLKPTTPASMSVRLELMVADVPKSVAFYTGVLGFTLLDGGDSSYAGVNAGSVTLGLQSAESLGFTHYFNPELKSQRRGLGTEIVLEVDDVANAFAAVQQAHSETLSPLAVQPFGLTDFRMADPDGYYLRITSR